MKRIAMATVVICLIAVLHVMGQTTATTTSTSTSKSAAKPAANSTAKPTATTASASTSAAKPDANSTAKPAAKPVPKPALYWDGTGPWQRPGGEAHADKKGPERTDKWPTPTYGQPQSEQPGQEMNARGEYDATAQGSNNLWRCRGPEKRPCTQGEVSELSRRMAEKRAEHPALAHIDTLTLESREGALSCRQADGVRCTHEQLKVLNEHVAEPLRYEIYEARPNSVSPTSTAQNHAPATSRNVSKTPTSASPTETGTTKTPSSASTTTNTKSSTPNHSATTQNHPPAGWQNRNSTTQNHASTTGKQDSTPPKKP